MLRLPGTLEVPHVLAIVVVERKSASPQRASVAHSQLPASLAPGSIFF